MGWVAVFRYRVDLWNGMCSTYYWMKMNSSCNHAVCCPALPCLTLLCTTFPCPALPVACKHNLQHDKSSPMPSYFLRWLGAWQITDGERWTRCWYWPGNWRHEGEGLRHRTRFMVQAKRYTFLFSLPLFCCIEHYNTCLAKSKERENDTSPVCTDTSLTPSLSFSFVVFKGMSNFKRLGIITRNPGKSKHVEIAAVRVGSIPVDLVNLISPIGELYRIVPYRTVLYRTVLHRDGGIILQYTKIQHYTMTYRTVPHYVIPYYIIPYRMVWYHVMVSFENFIPTSLLTLSIQFHNCLFFKFKIKFDHNFHLFLVWSN